jgi:PAS domain-containing protein
VNSQQRPLELIHARNLLSSVATPSFLVDVAGEIIYFNEAAGAMMGRRFEETGKISHNDWRAAIGPFDDEGNPIPFERLPLNLALRKGRPHHLRHMIRIPDGGLREIEVSGVPLFATGGGFRGAIIFIWPVNGQEKTGGEE